ncbi:MAG: hypothetical protein M3Y27_23320 [Acidobacteriota bacterium]|nr:hypothetical protein [Acidobacteriota bacterium]
MVEIAFLDVILQYLTTGAALAPAPATIGIAEPTTQADVPAVVLSLESIGHPANGLGERSVVMTGALVWTASIDLTNPVLPQEPGFRLLSDDRLTLILPHGGLVRADGTEGALGPTDISVKVGGVSRPAVNVPPVGNQVRPDPLVGQLLFGTALPPAGIVEARYNIGQWEQRVSRATGALRLAVRASDITTVKNLSNSVMLALQEPLTPIPGLRALRLTSLASISAAEQVLPNSFGRTLIYSFEFEQEINRPESSGGIIRRIPVTANLS